MCVNLRERICAPSSAAFGIHPRWGHCSWDEGDLFTLEGVKGVCLGRRVPFRHKKCNHMTADLAVKVRYSMASVFGLAERRPPVTPNAFSLSH
jgi:hypothetical protein